MTSEQTLISIGVVGVVVFTIAVLALVVHDARHCTKWEPYTYTMCQSYGDPKNGPVTTICHPVDSKRCIEWDDTEKN